MECKQEPKFQPITITLETAQEAEALWAVLERRVESQSEQKIINDLADWFSQQAQL